jgi:DNA-binding MarR family transcriptional regulator
MADPLTPPELRAWRAFVESSWALHTQLEDELRAGTGLSMADYHVLVVLSEAPDQRLRMGELAGRLVFSPSRCTYQVTSMVKRGLVARRSCPADGRGQEAVLTAEGLARLEAAAPQHLATVRECFVDDLDDTDIAVITRLFERLGPRLRARTTGPRERTGSPQ